MIDAPRPGTTSQPSDVGETPTTVRQVVAPATWAPDAVVALLGVAA